jgi:hypothetical protein
METREAGSTLGDGGGSTAGGKHGMLGAQQLQGGGGDHGGSVEATKASENGEVGGAESMAGSGPLLQRDERRAHG